MSRVPAIVLSAVLFAALSCWPATAGADPIRVVSGVMEAGGTLGDPWDAEDLHLSGPDISLGSSLEDEVAFFRLATPFAVSAGTLVDLSGVLRVEDAVGAQFRDGFVLVSAPFEVSFHASPVHLTCSGIGTQEQCTAVAPFTFDAELTFTTIGRPLEMHQLVGGGTVTGRFFPAFNGGGARFVIEAPTPEPATFALLASGAIGIASRRRRRGVRA